MSEQTLDDLSAIEMQLERVKSFVDYPGFDLILDGLMLLAAHIEQQTLTDQTIDHLLEVVSEFADAVDQPKRPVTVQPITQPAPIESAGAPEHIVALFREEARKRLAGLSISMMGIFYPETAELSIDQSTGHLHAVKGSSAMIGFPSISKLSAAMERVIFSLRTVDPDERGSALRPLLRSYSVLESLVEAVGSSNVSHDVPIDIVMRDLRRLLGEKAPEEEQEIPRGTFDRSAKTGVQEYPTKRILVVDDDPTVSSTVALVLSDLGAEIVIADNGAQALDTLSEQPFSLVISDISMPHIDGLTLLDEIKKTDALSDIPVILLTARQDERPAQASDVIIKGSIGSGELRARVDAILIDAPIVPYSEVQVLEKRILIVEDAETIAASIAFVLSQEPYEITIAYDGQDGWEKLNAQTFDAVISDWRMPRMNGLQLLENIRASESMSHLPVIMLTSTDNDELRRDAEAAGVNRFVLKGEVGSDALLSMLGSVLGA